MPLKTETREEVLNAYDAQKDLTNKMWFAFNYNIMRSIVNNKENNIPDDLKGNMEYPDELTTEQSKIRLITDDNAFKDVAKYAFNGKEKATSIAGCRRAYEVLGGIKAKFQTDLGSKYENIKKSLPKEKDKEAREYKAAYLLQNGDVDAKFSSMALEEDLQKVQSSKLGKDAGVEKYITTQMKAMLANWKDIDFNSMLDIMEVTDKKTRENFLKQLNVTGDGKVEDYVSTESTREKGIDSLVQNVFMAWNMQGREKAYYNMSDSEKKNCDLGEKAMNQTLCEANPKYESWIENTGKRQAEEMLAKTSNEKYKSLNSKVTTAKNMGIKLNKAGKKNVPISAESIIGLYNAIDKADASYISSSPEFEKMKKQLEELKEISKIRDQAPERYQLYKDRSRRSMAVYINKKRKEIADKGKDYVMSSNEKIRLGAVTAAYNRLSVIDKVEKLKAGNDDKRIEINDDISYETAKDFLEAQDNLLRCQEELLDYLETMKMVLVSTQEDVNKNFEHDTEADMEGSKTYKGFTQAIEGAIKALKSDWLEPEILDKKLRNVISKADEYRKDHEGIIFGPASTNGQVRLAQSVSACTTGNELYQAYVNLRGNLNRFKDENGISYGEKTYNEIDEKGADIKENNRENIINGPDLKFDKAYAKKKTLASLEVQIRNGVSKYNKFAASNFKKGASADYISARRDTEELNAENLAKDYVAYKYLKESTSPDATKANSTKLLENIKNGTFKKEYKQLASNMDFQKMVETNPHKCLSNWENAEKQLQAQKQAENAKNAQNNATRKVTNAIKK
ncbi:MAG: hypothetical protein K5659_01600 [Lachnospiraceae bacterium]|nr:hypothetical protein [Lachnospiraceae bacterium]